MAIFTHVCVGANDLEKSRQFYDAALAPRDLCEQNARLKAEGIAKSNRGKLVLGADTLVYLDSIPIGKPKSEQEAVATLAKLSGRRHSVCTGLCLVLDSKVHMFSEVTEVVFRSLTDEMIRQYMEKVNVMDKAGSYAIQDHGEMVVESMHGDFSNVVGLPQQRVKSEINVFRSSLNASC